MELIRSAQELIVVLQVIKDILITLQLQIWKTIKPADFLNSDVFLQIKLMICELVRIIRRPAVLFCIKTNKFTRTHTHMPYGSCRSWRSIPYLISWINWYLSFFMTFTSSNRCSCSASGSCWSVVPFPPSAQMGWSGAKEWWQNDCYKIQQHVVSVETETVVRSKLNWRQNQDQLFTESHRTLA